MESEISALIKQIYAGRKYPDKNIFVVNEKAARNVFETIRQNCPTNNVEFEICADCDYCYYILLSESRSIALPPVHHPVDKKNRKTWVRQYGTKHYTMRIVLSRLAKYSLIYWSKYSWNLFVESQKISFVPPDEIWKEIFVKVSILLLETGTKVFPPSLINKHYEIEFRSGILGVHKSPTVRELLFCEELH